VLQIRSSLAGDRIRLSSLDPPLDSLILVTWPRHAVVLGAPSQSTIYCGSSELRFPNGSSAAFELYNRPGELCLLIRRQLRPRVQPGSSCSPTSASRCKKISHAAQALTEANEVASRSYGRLVYFDLAWPPIRCGKSWAETAGSHPIGGTHALAAAREFKANSF
jgi:hypothetical protein